jgi:hypothetical protein
MIERQKMVAHIAYLKGAVHACRRDDYDLTR